MTRVRKQGRHTALCAHPGCKKTIREGTWNWPTGLCMDHQPQPEPPPPDPRKRTALVHLIPGCSSLSSHHTVSVPREPWL